MTVSSIEPVNNYAGNNSATKFDFDFFIENENELLVQHTNKAGYQTTLKLNTDYTINEIGSENGSYIIFPIDGSDYDVLKEDEVITLSLDLQIVQEKEFKNSSKLSLKVLESAFDYVTRLIQILNRRIERAVKVKEGITIEPDKLMDEVQETANQSLYYSTQSEIKSNEAKESANLAKEWAIKEDEKVEGKDYSSKYYAKKSKENAEIAEEKAEETNEVYQTAKEDIQKRASEKIDEITDEADKQFGRIQSLGFYRKDGKFYYTNELGEETSLKFEKTDNLFDLIQKDHKLSFEEKEGLELLGEYVYKEAQDGRYGYSDFYETCLKEYKSEENITENVYVSSNITGEIIDINGNLSGFTSNNYAIANKEVTEFDEKSWEIIIKVKMPDKSSNTAIVGSGAGTQKYGLSLRTTTANKITLYLSGNSTSWNIANAVASSPVFELGKEYLIKISYSLNDIEGSEDKTAKYTVDLTENITGEEKGWINYITKEINVTSTTEENTYKTAKFRLSLGIDNETAFTGGEIDLHKSYFKIASTMFWQGVQTVEVSRHPNGHKYYNISEKEAIDTIYKNNGAAWYYGVDEAKERIFLPRNDYIKYMSSGKIPVYGSGLNLGLTDGTKNYGMFLGNDWTGYNQVYTLDMQENLFGLSTPSYVDGDEPGGAFGVGITTNPEKSGITADLKSAQKEQNYYIYMVVGNTTVTYAQTKVTEVQQSQNDTIPLFTGMYFDIKPNHTSWIKAGTNVSGEIYESAYNTLINILNGSITKYGSEFKIVDKEQMVDLKDYSEYWVIDKDINSFRSPLKTSLLNTISNDRILIKKKEPADDDSTWYNLYSDGWVEQGGHIETNKAATVFTVEFLKAFKDTNYYFNNAQYSQSDDYCQYVTNKQRDSIQVKGQNDSSGFDWIAKGYTTAPNASEIANNEKTGLYFKIGNAVENLQLINAGEVLEELNNAIKKTDCISYLTETYKNGTSGYKVWSDGYCEQWGKLPAGQANIQVQFLKVFADSDYNAHVTAVTNANNKATNGNIGILTNVGMTVISDSYAYPLIWEAKGYLAAGEY